MIGAQLGPYRVVGKLGEGGMGVLGTVQAEYFGNGLSVSPNGQTLLFNAVTRSDADLMVINNFR